MTTFDQNPYELLTNDRRPVTVIQQRKQTVNDNYLYWVIQNHIPRKDGRVDWKATAEELARQLGEQTAVSQVLSERIERQKATVVDYQQDAEWTQTNIIRPIKYHWSRFLLPRSVRVALGVEW